MTIVELMVSVVIVSVIMTIAVATVSTEPDVRAEAHQVAAIVREASRQAVATKELDLQDMAVNGGQEGPIRVVLHTDEQGNQFLGIGRYDFAAQFGDLAFEPYSVPFKTYFLGAGARIVGSSPRAELAGGSTPDKTIDPKVPPGFGYTETLYFKHTGDSSSFTLYLEGTGNDKRRARVIVMALNGMVVVRDGW